MTTVDRPTAADFLARHRGGGLFTETVSQRLGARAAVLAHRRGLAPTVLTLGNLVIGLAAAGWVIAAADRLPALAVGLPALLLWHTAYALDCADGQLARVTGQTSPAGKRVDVLCDVALQIALVAAVSEVAVRQAEPAGSGTAPPTWLIAAFAGTWLVNLVTSILQQGTAAQSLVTSGSLPVRLIKLIRDYGAVVTVVGLVIAVLPGWTVWLMAGFTAVNGLFLLASIAAAARASLPRTG
jgi:phosphatidylglycerophosphate synthase